ETIPVHRTLEAVLEVMRHQASGYQAGQKAGEYRSLDQPGCRDRFLASWNKFAELIWRKITAGVDPHLQALFDDSSDFQDELNLLFKDRTGSYIDDRTAGEKFLVLMRDNGRPVPALIVKHRHSFLPWLYAWSDAYAPDVHSSPPDRHFHLFATIDPDQGW